MDNIFTERLWRTVKYENVYLMHYETVPEGMYNGPQNLDSVLSSYFLIPCSNRVALFLGIYTNS